MLLNTFKTHLQAAIDSVGEDIIIAVQSPELDANPGFLLTPDKPQYPDSVISGGYATITPDGKQAVVLNMSLFDDSFNDDDVNATEDCDERARRS